MLQGYVRLHSEGSNITQYTSVLPPKKTPLFKSPLTWHCYRHCLFEKASRIVLYTANKMGGIKRKTKLLLHILLIFKSSASPCVVVSFVHCK